MPNIPRDEALYSKTVEPYVQDRAAEDTLAAGITTVRDRSEDGEGLFLVPRALTADICPRPRIVLSGRVISASSPDGREFDDTDRIADGSDEMRDGSPNVKAELNHPIAVLDRICAHGPYTCSDLRIDS